MKDRSMRIRAWIATSVIPLLFMMIVTIAACSRPGGAETSEGDADTSHASQVDTVTDSLAIPLRTSDGKPARFAFRSGRITMHFGGDYRGIRRLVFDDYGLKESKFDSAVPAERVMAVVPPYQLTIITPEYYGGVDLRTGKGQSARNAAYSRYVASPEASKTPFGEMALERSGGTRLPDTTLLGKYLCRVYKRSYPDFTQTMWLWGGVPIREEMQVKAGMSGNYVLEPISIETNIDVPDSLFSFPTQYEIKEVAPPPGG